MLRKIVTTTGKRIYKKLPKNVQSKALQVAAPHIYKIHTKGIVANSQMVEFVKKNPRPVSIVIPSYNDYPLLKACLESIYRTCGNFNYEVIVVDDYCQPANRELLKTLANDRVRVILKEQREGFAKAVNRGMSEAKHDILLLNSDIVAQDGWLEALQYSAYQIDEKIGLVSPKLVYPDGRIQYGGTYYARVLAPQWFGHLFVGRAATTPVANVPYYNRSISGACVYITTKAFKEIKLLDDTYWLGFEDVDYGLKAWDKGIRCYYQPASMLIHYESASRGYSQGKRELASMRYFWSKWDHLFLSRALNDDRVDIDYVVSDSSTVLWKEYVVEQAAMLASQGYKAHVYSVKADDRDEGVIAKLSKRNSLKVCCDWGAQTTVWLSSLEHGKPVYLLPGVESSDYGADPEQQAKIIAQYRPEFDYVAPNRWTADQLRAESAWEATQRVIPAIAPLSLLKSSGASTVIVIDASKEQRSELDRIINSSNMTGHYVETKDIDKKTLEHLRSLNPRAVVVLSEAPNSLLGLSLMSLGGGYVGIMNDKTRYEVLDGYNALLVNPGDLNAIEKALTDVLTDDEVWTDLRSNGHKSAVKFYELNKNQISGAFEMIARTAV